MAEQKVEFLTSLSGAPSTDGLAIILQLQVGSKVTEPFGIPIQDVPTAVERLHLRGKLPGDIRRDFERLAGDRHTRKIGIWGRFGESEEKAPARGCKLTAQPISSHPMARAKAMNDTPTKPRKL
ncbi:hypothetical protein [Bradyrhizobium sp. USDA 3256]